MLGWAGAAGAPGFGFGTPVTTAEPAEVAFIQMRGNLADGSGAHGLMAGPHTLSLPSVRRDRVA
jgi:hypothetical protein